MGHPNLEKGKETTRKKVQAIAGTRVGYEHPNDKAYRIAYGDRRVPGIVSPDDQATLEQK